MRENEVLRKRFYGPGAQAKLGIGYKLLDQLRNHMDLGGLQQLILRKWIDSTYYEVSSVFGQNEIRIFNTHGEESRAREVVQLAGELAVTHVVWGNVYPGSSSGFVGFFDPEDAINFFPTQKDGLISGLRQGASTFALDDYVQPFQISVVSPATYILGDFNRNTYASNISLEELASGYREFGKPPFQSVDVELWFTGANTFVDLETFVNPAFNNSANIPAFIEYFNTLDTGNLFTNFTTFFNQVRIAHFHAQLLGQYFRENGNPSNANIEDDYAIPFQDKYLIADMFAGVIDKDGDPEFFSSQFATVDNPNPEIETGLDIYGDLFVDFVKLFEEDVYTYWYTSERYFKNSGEIELMRAPTELEVLVKNSKVYEQTGEFDLENEFYNVPASEHAKVLRQIGIDISEEIPKRAIVRGLSKAALTISEREMITE